LFVVEGVILGVYRYFTWKILAVTMLSVIILFGSCNSSQTEKHSEPLSNTPVTIPARPATDEQSSYNTEEPSSLILQNPAKVDNSNLPITPLEELHLTGLIPDVDLTQYRLTIDGLVKAPLSLSYRELFDFTTVTETVLLICPGVFADNAEWSGIPISVLLSEAAVDSQASEVVFHAIGNYKQTLPLEIALQEDMFLAHTVNGQTLPIEHGYPVRLVAKGRYGNEWVKWVERIEVK
jgi:sulfoxide reductase catalytic subunit YedY